MPTETLRFAEFTLDLGAERLERGGERVHLAPQSMRLLIYLAGNPDRLVTREELKQHLWGDRAVEHEQGIGFLVRQVRVALGDDATEPRFIETVPRRGFRFVATVERDPATVPGAPETTVSAAMGITKWGRAALVIIIVAAVAIVYLNTRPQSPPSRAVALVVGDETLELVGGEYILTKLAAAIEEQLLEQPGVVVVDTADPVGPFVLRLGLSANATEGGDALTVSLQYHRPSGVTVWQASFSGSAAQLLEIERDIAEDVGRVVGETRNDGAGPGTVEEVERTRGVD